MCFLHYSTLHYIAFTKHYTVVFVIYYIIVCYLILYCIILYCNLLYSTIIVCCCSVLYCIVSYCIVFCIFPFYCIFLLSYIRSYHNVGTWTPLVNLGPAQVLLQRPPKNQLGTRLLGYAGVCMYMYVYTCMYIQKYIHVCIYVCIHMYVYLCLCGLP